ncbi:MAG TPA: methylmalonyl Co-A mutase-associated GTPase MeaB [Thermodesulfobacteriota bacterium]|nr:methylmalonyl Co-A mutase-associated GTPase MeaB [Thermodesulfobacteriota bacterium]
MKSDIKLVDEALSGSVRALGRLISLIEDEAEESQAILKELYSRTGKARVIGVTGPSGVGKSTLLGRLTEKFLERKLSIGILAVDPSSPISGGSLLGDRIRLSFLPASDKVFIRSLSSRGALGGLSQATMNVVRVLDAVGYDVIIVETIGVGQDEIEVAHIADTMVLILAPGFGDEIQALKAGIIELADIFVVNKIDLSDANMYVAILEKIARESSSGKSWVPPVVKTSALHNQGMEALVTEIDNHAFFLREHGSRMHLRKNKLRHEIVRLTDQCVRNRLEDFLKKCPQLELLAGEVVEGRKDSYSAANQLANLFGESFRERSQRGEKVRD